MKVIIANTDKEIQDAFTIRTRVFVDEQQVPEEEEIDKFESTSTHFVLYDHNTPVGAGRFRILDGIGKVERICVIKDYRGKGAGFHIMEAIHDYAKSKVQSLKLNAQTQAIPFYEKLGYTVDSEEFLDAGIPHKTMIKAL
ncbi:GNAT family N-acetyltransferase [Bacillus spongiae]|uniref:GNAT family N-acetyltransferase n=1 Tax=Bacillus spongiae TaxID=2683610 RepID=A0ABU8HB75_9BACI